MDSKSVRHWPVNKVKSTVRLYEIPIAPDVLYRIMYMVPKLRFILAAGLF